MNEAEIAARFQWLRDRRRGLPGPSDLEQEHRGKRAWGVLCLQPAGTYQDLAGQVYTEAEVARILATVMDVAIRADQAVGRGNDP